MARRSDSAWWYVFYSILSVRWSASDHLLIARLLGHPRQLSRHARGLRTNWRRRQEATPRLRRTRCLATKGRRNGKREVVHGSPWGFVISGL